jgi:hypothetical protein
MIRRSHRDVVYLAVLRIWDVYPRSRILIFTYPGSENPKTATKERGEKNSCHTFFWSHKFHKFENYFTFVILKIKIWADFQSIIELFTQKTATKLSKIWVWDLGSEIRGPNEIRDQGSGKKLFRIPGPKRHRIPDLQHCYLG